MNGRRFGIAVLGIAAIISAVSIIGRVAGFRVNLTHSAPLGLWRVQGVDTSTLKRGDLIEVCPPPLPVVKLMALGGYLEPGDCTGTHVAPFLKPVAATAGDRVTLQKGRAVSVNGYVLPHTAAMQLLPAWSAGTYTVPPGHIWIFSTYSTRSFDSRYFGPVDLASVRGRASPIAINGDISEMTRLKGGPRP